MIELPGGILPIRDLTTREILYGSRSSKVRYELLEHDSVTGRDHLAGYLDGVTSGSLSWQANRPVKKSGSLVVTDLAKAAEGMTRIADVDLSTVRIRPVREVEGLPDFPLGAYLISESPEKWSGTHREVSIEIHDRTTVLEQDAFDETFTAAPGEPILSIVKDVVASAGEAIDVDASDLRQLTAPMVWPVEASKLTIVNDLLKVLDYRGLWTDNDGALRATVNTRPAQRSIAYEALNDEEGVALIRELVDGDEAIYLPDFDLDRSFYKVPNKVRAVAAGSGDAAPLVGVATNEDPESPYSYQRRGNRWRVATISGVEVPDYSGEPDPAAATIEFLNERARRGLIAASSVQSTVKLQALPFPFELLDAIRFASTPAGIDARHTISSAEIDLAFDGFVSPDLQEVIDL